MSDPRWPGALLIAAWLIVVVAGVSRRRMPRATLWRYAGVWAAIFALLFLGSLWLDGRLRL